MSFGRDDDDDKVNGGQMSLLVQWFHLLSYYLIVETLKSSKIHCEDWRLARFVSRYVRMSSHERKAIENIKEVLSDSISLLWWWVYYHWALFIIVRPIRHLCYALHIEFGNLGHNNLSGVVRVKFQKRRQGGAENGKRPLFASCVSDFCCGISFLSAKSWKWLTEG